MKKRHSQQHHRSFDDQVNATTVTTTSTSEGHQFEEEEEATRTVTVVEKEEVEESSDEDDDDDDYDDNEEDDYYDEDNSEFQQPHHHDLHRPKLDEGYYEIEAVRRKRFRKGQLQYFIKWRGWPETANTWEPLDNLQSCSDVIDAFEESLQYGKSRSARKRKRKSGATYIQPKKKLQSPSTAGIAATLRRVNLKMSDKPLASVPINDSSFSDTPSVAYQPDKRVVNTNEISEKIIKNVSTNGSSDIRERKQCNELDMRINELKGTTSAGEISVDKFGLKTGDGKAVTGEKNVNEPFKVDCLQPVQNNRCIGARRRKSGSVKRFKQDSALSKPYESQNEITRISVGSNYRAEPLDIENKFDGFNNACDIVKIIKPISYSTSVTNNFQDVSVTFTAVRSDGKEVTVDNKFLKHNNPLLLINFYEQHLRYNPTS